MVYALPEGEDAVLVELADGGSALDAVRASGLLERHPEIDLKRQKLGIFGRVVPPEARPAEGDRIEIYRPLALDPKEARRGRALGRRGAKR